MKQAKHHLEAINPDSVERSALSTAQRGTWVGDDPNIQELLEQLITEKTTTPLETVKDVGAKVIGGMLEHRDEGPWQKALNVNYDPNTVLYPYNYQY